MLTKVLWGVLGLAMWGLAATGLLVYGLRRGGSVTVSDRLGRATTGFVAGGLPFATAAAAMTWAAAVALEAPGVHGAMTASFAGALAVAGAAGLFGGVRQVTVLLFASAGALFAALPAAAAVATGAGPVQVWSNTATAWTLIVDAALAGFGLLLMAAALGLQAARPAAAGEPAGAREAVTIRGAGLDLDDIDETGAAQAATR